MTPERWLDVERLFHGALERPICERAAFLSASSAGDDALRGEVESLLQQHYLAGTFLEEPFRTAFRHRSGSYGRGDRDR
jgi:hypothetical protein